MVLGLLLLTTSVDTAIPPFQKEIKARAFLNAHIDMTPTELSEFMEMCYKGSNEDRLPALTWVCLAETNWDYRLRDKYGRLGGHYKTILKGAHEMGQWPTERQLEDHPELKTKYLAVRFNTLYNRFNHNLEKTCRVWNQGPGWKNKKADKYWHTICHFKHEYEVPSNRNLIRR